MSAAEQVQPQTANGANPPVIEAKEAKDRRPPSATRTMDQIDRKLEAHSPQEQRAIMAYLSSKWSVQ